MGIYAEKIAALEDALASGELTVESDGDRVTYRSIADLAAALRYFQDKEAAADTPTSERTAFGFSAVGFCRE